MTEDARATAVAGATAWHALGAEDALRRQGVDADQGLSSAEGSIARVAGEWASNTYDETVARTMGMIAFSISNVASSFAAKDERRSVFSIDIIGDRPFLSATAASIAAIVLMTESGFFNRLLDTTNLNLEQWVVCILVGILIIPISEVGELIIRKPLDEAAPVAEALAA